MKSGWWQRNTPTGYRPRVAIIGAGFGGLSTARALRNTPVDVTLIDQHNYHLFQPLLYQVATAGLPATAIAWPIRAILRHQTNASVLLDRVTGIDVKARCIQCASHDPVHYDILVLATGVRHAYFGHDDWEAHAPGLKNLDDAIYLRRRILTAFEQAEMTTDPEEQQRLLTFVVVGAGPTGVEMAGALAELAHRTLIRDFRMINPDNTRIILVEAGPRILPTYTSACSGYGHRTLDELGVEVRVGEAVTECNADGVVLGQTTIPAGTVIWAAGIEASARTLGVGANTDRAGRIFVNDRLTIPDHPEIYVIGDMAAARGRQGNPLPGIAPVAKQQGRYVAQAITAHIKGKKESSAFRYRHYGNLATIGRNAAVVDL
ncbi:MAG TPA: NAD(P)/FAD-dependent oxidoreductase, partial [Gammaproteobacteria bacterium]|nr:NAD(P)/FAD-dependent oxidoreductase [Gammaproteobacteria bacterium]